MVLKDLFWLQLVLETVGLLDLFVLSVSVSSNGDGGLFLLTSESSSCRNGGTVTMIGVAYLFSIGWDSNMSTGSSAGGSGGTLSVASFSGSMCHCLVTEENQRSEEMFIFPLRSCSSTYSDSVTMLSVDADSGVNDGNADDVAALMILMAKMIFGGMTLLILIPVIIIQQS